MFLMPTTAHPLNYNFRHFSRLRPVRVLAESLSSLKGSFMPFCVSRKQPRHEGLTADLMVHGHRRQNRGQRANSERIVRWNREVMFPAGRGRQPYVTARLARDAVSELRQHSRQVIA
jgi:hypothetical protein